MGRIRRFWTCCGPTPPSGTGGERAARFADLVAVAPVYDLAAADARLTRVDRAYLWGRQFLNRAAFYGMPAG